MTKLFGIPIASTPWLRFNVSVISCLSVITNIFVHPNVVTNILVSQSVITHLFVRQSVVTFIFSPSVYGYKMFTLQSVVTDILSVSL